MVGGTPRILIIRLSAIGDVVRVIPALQILRHHYATAQIDWVVESKSREILEGHPALDELIVFNRSEKWTDSSREFTKLCRTLRRRRYDFVLDFHGILKSGLICRASGARNRIGFARPRSQEGSAFSTNHKVHLPLGTLNRCAENLQLCRALVPDAIWPSTMLSIPNEIQEAVDDYIDSEFDGGKLVVAMHPPVDRPEKQWPLEHFARLADMLMADGRFEVMLTYGPGQRGAIEIVRGLARRNPVIMPATPDLKFYAWLVHRAELYVGGDTGPMHIAAAMGTPVVAVYGGTNPAQHEPYNQPGISLTSPDAGNQPAKTLEVARERLAAISPDMVYEACVKMLNSRVGNGNQHYEQR